MRHFKIEFNLILIQLFISQQEIERRANSFTDKVSIFVDFIE
jgi:hypothetical protein